MAENTTVAFRVDKSIKNEWEEAADGPEYDSLSHLIRLSVQKEITNTQTAETEAQAGVERGGEILESLTRLEKSVEEIQEEVDVVSREKQAGELYDLKQVLLEVIPTVPETIDPFSHPEPEESESAIPTARDIAGRIGADTSDVAEALEQLEQNMGQIESIEDRVSEEIYYWREE